ncbi:MAG: peptidoglycan DD-metalloendopeptidase family protein [Candidatus Moranbacteria bacterium]|jgi:murein DD-endopeptidase MepM/ murein hydrolase activator NlpD|nr:peptidoglycan DD-metalloendopeptidase family protein [Candidatus Moranbacteria bacterium]
MNIYTNKNIYRQSEPAEKKSYKWKIIYALIIALVFYFIFNRLSSSKEIISKETEPESISSENIQPEKISQRVDSHTISEGDIPAEVFSEHGKFNANDTEEILSVAMDTYDFSNLKIGRDIRFYFDADEKAVRMEYDHDTETMIVVYREGEKFSVKKETIPYEVYQENISVNINNFLYIDAMNAGISEATILEIADIFSFDIDFTTEIQQGDSFTVIFEKRTRDGKQAPDGKVLAAKFSNSGNDYYGYYFDNGNEDGHYDSEGHFLVRQFLRAPLSYRQITSGYTGARLNPITKTVSAHYQIDYAAPTGTPVVATARGDIVSAGWEGGWGNIVRLRHSNGYTTHYGHLSAFGKGIKSGMQVSQGQVIGYVGSTGWSTGPHLDYGIKLNGAPINPLAMNLPKGDPLNADKMPEFEKVKEKYNLLLH